MLYYKTQEEIELIRESSLLVAKTLAEVAKAIRPGITTLELDRLAETFIRDHGAVPAFLNSKFIMYLSEFTGCTWNTKRECAGRRRYLFGRLRSSEKWFLWRFSIHIHHR